MELNTVFIGETQYMFTILGVPMGEHGVTLVMVG